MGIWRWDNFNRTVPLSYLCTGRRLLCKVNRLESRRVAQPTVIPSPRQTTSLVGAVPLQAAFTGTPRSGQSPLNVQFTDQSTGSPDQLVLGLWRRPVLISPEPVSYLCNPGIIRGNTYCIKTRCQQFTDRSELHRCEWCPDDNTNPDSDTGTIRPDHTHTRLELCFNT